MFLLAFLLALSATNATEPDEVTLQRDFSETVVPLLKLYCLDCHGTDLQEAQLDLSIYTSTQSVANGHRTWEIILERISASEMPPEDAERQPQAEERKAIVDWIRTAREFEALRHAGGSRTCTGSPVKQRGIQLLDPGSDRR